MVTSRQGVESADAPYFVDIVNEQLTDQFQDRDFQATGSRVYTTLDPDLQRDAAAAVAVGLKEVDSIIAKRHQDGTPVEDPQVALICLDPHTGEVKALIGGKNYGMSQLNHVLAKRPSGSIFKPFVYAAALNTGLWDHPNPITPSTQFDDEPRTFYFGGKAYEPTDFHKDAWQGQVTLRQALSKSLNVPAVEVAEAVGYGAVADLAHKAGLADIRATPAMALGSYDVTPLEMAGAYTLFANKGVMVKPRLISSVADKSGSVVFTSQPETKRILDPRVTYIMTKSDAGGSPQRNWRSRARSGIWPARRCQNGNIARCLVRRLHNETPDCRMGRPRRLSGSEDGRSSRSSSHLGRVYAASAQTSRISGRLRFRGSRGVVSAQIDPQSGALATSACPAVQTEFYVVGTQPVQFCPLHVGGSTQIAGWDPGQPAPPNPANPDGALQPGQTAQSTPPPDGQGDKKKSLFDKLKGIFK